MFHLSGHGRDHKAYGSLLQKEPAAGRSCYVQMVRGWYQEEGKEAINLANGDVVTIPAEVKHWHGAKKDSWFSHLAAECLGQDCQMNGANRLAMNAITA